MSASLSLGAPTDSPGVLFLKSQLWSTVQWPPETTNLEGKVAIVTGSNTGLGLEASRQLLSHGLSSLIIAVRSTSKGEQVASKFQAQYPSAKIYVWPLEMESYDSIQAFARRVEAELPRLDIVILNAGMQTAEFKLVPSTGHEQLIQINYLSTTLLAILLLPILKVKSPLGEPGRLSIVSSGTARGAKLSETKGTSILAALDDQSRPWKPVERYAVSKLLGHLFIVELVHYINADDVVVNLVDPGLVKGTDLQRFLSADGIIISFIAAFFYCMKAALGRTVPVGASTYVDAAVVKGKESHGCYVTNWKVSP